MSKTMKLFLVGLGIGAYAGIAVATTMMRPKPIDLDYLAEKKIKTMDSDELISHAANAVREEQIERKDREARSKIRTALKNAVNG